MPKEFLLKSRKKGFKRFWTPFIQEQFTRLQSLEEKKQTALKNCTAIVFTKFYQVGIAASVERSTTIIGSRWWTVWRLSTCFNRLQSRRLWATIEATARALFSSSAAEGKARFSSCRTRAIPALSTRSATETSSRTISRWEARLVAISEELERSELQDHHGSEYGRKEHTAAASGGEYYSRSDRLLRSCVFDASESCRSHLHSNWSSVGFGFGS